MADMEPSGNNGQVPPSSQMTEFPAHCGRILHKFLDVSTWAFFSISLSPLSLKEIKGHSLTGCLVVTCLQSQDNKSLREVRISTLIRSTWRKILTAISLDLKKELLNEIDNLLYYESDSHVEAQEALEKIFNSEDALLAGADEATWLLSPILRRFALLRRMAMPLHHMDIGSVESDILAECSLLDLFLDMPAICNVASRSLNERMGEIEECLAKTVDVKSAAELRLLQRMISSVLQRAGFSIIPVNRKHIVHTYIVPDKVYHDHCLVMKERNRLLQQLELRKENPGMALSHKALNNAIKLPQRVRGGTVLVTEREMSFEAFQAQSIMGEMVNRKLKRPYIPGISRPRLSAVSMPPQGINELRSIFFDEFGALNKDIVEDIDLSKRHSFISFSNGANDRGDLRWQVPLRRHSTNHVVHTRQRVEALLARYGCIDGNGEKLHDLAMLMGGTADQSLHHDIPRQTTSFLPYDPKEEQRKQKEQMIMAEPPRAMVAASGWEFDRAAYNDAMGSPLAPVSILIGMGDEFKVLVGVQRNQVDQRG
jgi:hypothetical protein